MTQPAYRVDVLLVGSSCTPTPLILLIHKEEHLILVADCRLWIILLLCISVHSNAHIVHGHVSFQLESIVFDQSLILIPGVERARL